MNYVEQATGKVVTAAEILRSSSTISFSVPLSPVAVRTAGYAELVSTPRPSTLTYQKATSSAELVDGVWTEVWTVVDTMTQAEWEAKQAATLEERRSDFSMTMRQCRLVLLARGKLADVDAAIASLPEPDKSAAATEWEYSHMVVRSSPFVALLGTVIGFTEDEIDVLFEEGIAL